ncbi:hypothetical protein [Polaribacter cellanae]|uniref:Uncharacterized protein n=1 Tax=Polaribacter cellanae TaxID=2818493 RepID=A0A975CPA4_9FLAO|nr:hypothetical protein [Polaribacter cellanae]QTE23258.1 hypothetical protein J3359_03000 [Polaribacter cellanae]
MVMVIKQGETKNNLKNILEKLSKKIKPKGIDVYKYVAKINLHKDALDIQRDLRNEW